MINKICISGYNPTRYLYSKVNRPKTQNVVKKYVHYPLVALTLLGSIPMTSSCVKDYYEPEISYNYCPYDKSDFECLCKNTQDRVNYTLQKLQILPNGTDISEVSRLSFSDETNRYELENIKVDDNRNISFNMRKIDSTGKEEAYSYKLVDNASSFIVVNRAKLDGEQAGEYQTVAYVSQSNSQPDAFLLNTIVNGWSECLYKKGESVIKEEKDGGRCYYKDFSFTKRL